MTDTTLIERFISGDINAFNMLIKKWEKPIYNYILRNTGDPETSRDLCQMTFIRVYKQLKKLRDIDKFSSWIYRIATNQCYDEFKRKKRKPSSQNSARDSTDMKQHMEIADKETRSPETLCNDKQVAAILQNALLQIPQDQRIVIIMKQYQGLKFSEIAESLNEPVNTVKSRMYYGLKGLRQQLQLLHLDKEILLNEM